MLDYRYFMQTFNKKLLLLGYMKYIRNTCFFYRLLMRMQVLKLVLFEKLSVTKSYNKTIVASDNLLTLYTTFHELLKNKSNL